MNSVGGFVGNADRIGLNTNCCEVFGQLAACDDGVIVLQTTESCATAKELVATIVLYAVGKLSAMGFDLEVGMDVALLMRLAVSGCKSFWLGWARRCYDGRRW